MYHCSSIISDEKFDLCSHHDVTSQELRNSEVDASCGKFECSLGGCLHSSPAILYQVYFHISNI